MRKYQLSYDTIDCDGDFGGDHNEARRFILCVLAESAPDEIHSYNESCFVIYYPTKKDRLFAHLKTNLASYFYYTVSLVSVYHENQPDELHYIDNNPNLLLDRKLQGVLSKLTCSFDGKTITPY